ncbi:hypothetical protein J437_LFUL017945 [Ladona fulva]|uniref:Uncharacterized protein n=1 Tax=Ladona fulva TaxID=123851 RepID=A0A8K0KQA2_LADFU|nr:hypothetical protein J437_LFUL017945 [Ladona fulva]
MFCSGQFIVITRKARERLSALDSSARRWHPPAEVAAPVLAGGICALISDDTAAAQGSSICSLPKHGVLCHHRVKNSDRSPVIQGAWAEKGSWDTVYRFQILLFWYFDTPKESKDASPLPGPMTVDRSEPLSKGFSGPPTREGSAPAFSLLNVRHSEPTSITLKEKLFLFY